MRPQTEKANMKDQRKKRMGAGGGKAYRKLRRKYKKCNNSMRKGYGKSDMKYNQVAHLKQIAATQNADVLTI